MVVDDASLVVVFFCLGVGVVTAFRLVDATSSGVGLIFVVVVVVLLLRTGVTGEAGFNKACLRGRRPTRVESGVTGTGGAGGAAVEWLAITAASSSSPVWVEVILRGFLVTGGRGDDKGIFINGVVGVGIVAVWMALDGRRPRFAGVVVVIGTVGMDTSGWLGG